MDKITLTNAEFWVHVGVPEQERHKKQRILMDLDLFCSFKNAITSDNLEDTINYASVRDFVEDFLYEKKYHLIEKLAGDVATAVYKTFTRKNCPIKRIMIVVKKPEALKGKSVDSVSVTHSTEFR